MQFIDSCDSTEITISEIEDQNLVTGEPEIILTVSAVDSLSVSHGDPLFCNGYNYSIEETSNALDSRIDSNG